MRAAQSHHITTQPHLQHPLQQHEQQEEPPLSDETVAVTTSVTVGCAVYVMVSVPVPGTPLPVHIHFALLMLTAVLKLLLVLLVLLVLLLLPRLFSSVWHASTTPTWAASACTLRQSGPS